jgi:endonuclease-3
MEKLLELPGVGRKVANCVLVNSFDIPAIPVDTHVHRISNRTGWVQTKDPEQTEKALEQLFPKELWTLINYTLVSYGKTICKPINPNCTECVVADRCPKKILVPEKKNKKK